MADKAQGSDTKKSKLNLEKLGDFFDAADVEWRAQRSGYNARTKKPWVMVMPFITNRGVMARLDEVCGPAGWRNEYKDSPGITKGVLCGISILVDGEWITKWDGADQTSMEAVKGGLSNSMKRAAVQWGIGRYLYMMETQYVEVKEKGQHYISSKRGETPVFKGYWTDPDLPKWAVQGSKEEPPKNFKWKDPEDLEVSTPEIEEQRKAEARKKQQEEMEAKRAMSSTQPIAGTHPMDAVPAAEKKPDQVTANDPRIQKFQDLIARKIKPEIREDFVDAIIGSRRPKTMGQIEILIAMLEKRADLEPPKTQDVVLDDIDDRPITEADIAQAFPDDEGINQDMQDAMNRDRS